MGCGKSAAAKLIAEHGYQRLDSDAVIRDIILAETPVAEAIREKFGDRVMTPDKHVDRAALARIVFADADALRWLENLIHPRLFAHWRTVFAADRRLSWVVEVPLLFEKELQNWFDFTVCVTSSLTLQLARLEQRGIPPALARPRISQQLPLGQKAELADFVLTNDGTPDFLRAQVNLLASSLSAAR